MFHLFSPALFPSEVHAFLSHEHHKSACQCMVLSLPPVNIRTSREHIPLHASPRAPSAAAVSADSGGTSGCGCRATRGSGRTPGCQPPTSVCVCAGACVRAFVVSVGTWVLNRVCALVVVAVPPWDLTERPDVNPPPAKRAHCLDRAWSVRSFGSACLPVCGFCPSFSSPGT